MRGDCDCAAAGRAIIEYLSPRVALELKVGIALGAAALTREQTQGNIRRGHRILVYGFDVLMLRQHARKAAEWARS